MKRALLLPLSLVASALAALPASASAASGVDVTRFHAAGAEAQLGHGTIVVSDDPADSGLNSGLPVYEHAVMDALARFGYDTQSAPNDSGQLAEIRVTHAELQPPEARHKPVSGAMGTTISNRGSGFGLALNIDLSKPKGALVSTRLEVRIRDRASGKVLWEGRAETADRASHDHGLNHAKVADKLVAALFHGFPSAGEVVAAD